MTMQESHSVKFIQHIPKTFNVSQFKSQVPIYVWKLFFMLPPNHSSVWNMAVMCLLTWLF